MGINDDQQLCYFNDMFGRNFQHFIQISEQLVRACLILNHL